MKYHHFFLSCVPPFFIKGVSGMQTEATLASRVSLASLLSQFNIHFLCCGNKSPRYYWFDKLHDVFFYSSFFILFLRDRMGNICSLFLILFPFHEQLHLFHDKIRLCDFINHEKSIPLYSIILWIIVNLWSVLSFI